MNLEATKLELIKMIADVQSERLLERLKQFFRQEAKKATVVETLAMPITSQQKGIKAPIPKNGADDPDALWQLAAQPIPQSIDLEQLKKEQGYDTEKLSAHFKNLDRSAWENEDMAELLKILRK